MRTLRPNNELIMSGQLDLKKDLARSFSSTKETTKLHSVMKRMQPNRSNVHTPSPTLPKIMQSSSGAASLPQNSDGKKTRQKRPESSWST